MAELRILVIRLSSMGDVIHTLPAVASLKHRFPHSHLTWLVRPRWTPLLEGNPYVDEVVAVERSVSASFAEARRLRARHFDLAVDFQGLIQTALLGAAARPRKLAGFDRTQVRERWAALFYSSEVPTQAAHVVERNLELAAGAELAAGTELAAGAGAANLPRTFPLPPGAPEGSLPDGRFILASPFAGWGSKQWPLEYWSELSGMLELPLVVNGPPNSEAELRKIRGVHVHLSGIPGLIDATRRAHAVIGVDSGPLHLAAALGKPGVAIYGPTDPARNGPYGGTIRVLRSAEALTDYSRGSQPHPSILEISPARVARMLTSVLETSSTRCTA
ncbi:MAG: lipopolysaccharide heptosyltransferase family protein [Bryobacterales bacterium]|nr:lipopolysaccharide heptosyltransferase family protein [Bryobacterales bacterium]